MKRIITIVSLVFIPGILFAQRTNKNAEEKSDDRLNERAFLSRSRVMTFSQMNQRRIYNWATGQRATPSGRQAGQKLKGTYVRVFGDSAVVIRKPSDKTASNR